MNKLLLALLSISAIITFCFLAPLYLMIFGLCILLSGAIGISQPAALKSQRIRHLFHKRITGVFVSTIGIALLSVGSISTYQLYLSSANKENMFDLQLSNQNPQAFGSNTTRPVKEQERDTIQQKIVGEFKQLVTQTINNTPYIYKILPAPSTSNKKQDNNTMKTSLPTSKDTIVTNDASSNTATTEKNNATGQDANKVQQNTTEQTNNQNHPNPSEQTGDQNKHNPSGQTGDQNKHNPSGQSDDQNKHNPSGQSGDQNKQNTEQDKDKKKEKKKKKLRKKMKKKQKKKTHKHQKDRKGNNNKNRRNLSENEEKSFPNSTSNHSTY